MTSRSLVLSAFAVATFVACAREPALPDARDPLPPVANAAPICPIGGCLMPEGDDASKVRAGALCSTPEGCQVAAQSACADTEASKCRTAALALWSQTTGTHAMGQIEALFERACTLGDVEGCHYSGRLMSERRPPNPDFLRGLASLERACDGDYAMSCTVLAQRIARSMGSSPTPYGGRYEAQFECLQGDASACHGLGVHYQGGTEHFPQDSARAARFYKKACDLGDTQACNSLGVAYYSGEGVERDVTHAETIFERACNEGEGQACGNLGMLYEYGEAVTADLARARTLYGTGCSAPGGNFSCMHLEMLDAYAAGVPHDPVQARAKWKAMCDAKAGAECAYLGLLIEDAHGGPADPTAESSLMRRACLSKYALACSWQREHSE